MKMVPDDLSLEVTIERVLPSPGQAAADGMNSPLRAAHDRGDWMDWPSQALCRDGRLYEAEMADGETRTATAQVYDSDDVSLTGLDSRDIRRIRLLA